MSAYLGQSVILLFSLLSSSQFCEGIGGTSLPVGAPFQEPSECTSSNCVLNLDGFEYRGPHASFNTRAFNGDIPGPTIRIKAGDELHLTVNNKLLDRNNLQGQIANNFRTPNTTNIHLHGMHISSNPGGDSIFQEILPGDSSFTYEYDIPDYHMAGTFWYHPHHHGSTAIQAGAGALGMLIVDDAENEIPLEYSSLPEKIVVFTHLNVAQLTTIQNTFSVDLLQPIEIEEGNGELLLVNGQTEPVMSISAGVWYRWRVLFSSLDSYYAFSFDDDSCQFQLMSKDGVYLNTVPRVNINELPLYGGARCDVLVSCDGSKSTVNLNAKPNNGAFRNQAHVWEGKVMSLSISGGSGAVADLPTFEIIRPCYLADTTSISDSNIDFKSTVRLNGGGTGINGVAFQGQGNYIDSFPTGSVVELDLFGIRGHPFHMHVNHYQINYLQFPNSYFQVGDWHDTFFFGDENPDPEVRVRFYTDRFTGSMVIHCHFLGHEDLGMMAEFLVTGNEGDVYTPASNTGCYSQNSGARGYFCRNCVSDFQPPTPVDDDTPTPIDDGTDDNPNPTPTPTESGSNPTVDLGSLSVSSCQDLGWTNAASFGSPLVCGESDDASLGGQCSGLLTWSEALDFCVKGGSRLCSLDELLLGEAGLTGCRYDREQVWSWSACGTGQVSVVQWRSSVLSAASDECVNVLERHVVRCCADDF